MHKYNFNSSCNCGKCTFCDCKKMSEHYKEWDAKQPTSKPKEDIRIRIKPPLPQMRRLALTRTYPPAGTDHVTGEFNGNHDKYNELIYVEGGSGKPEKLGLGLGIAWAKAAKTAKGDNSCRYAVDICSDNINSICDCPVPSNQYTIPKIIEYSICAPVIWTINSLKRCFLLPCYSSDINSRMDVLIHRTAQPKNWCEENWCDGCNSCCGCDCCCSTCDSCCSTIAYKACIPAIYCCENIFFPISSFRGWWHIDPALGLLDGLVIAACYAPVGITALVLLAPASLAPLGAVKFSGIIIPPVMMAMKYQLWDQPNNWCAANGFCVDCGCSQGYCCCKGAPINYPNGTYPEDEEDTDELHDAAEGHTHLIATPAVTGATSSVGAVTVATGPVTARLTNPTQNPPIPLSSSAAAASLIDTKIDTKTSDELKKAVRDRRAKRRAPIIGSMPEFDAFEEAFPSSRPTAAQLTARRLAPEATTARRQSATTGPDSKGIVADVQNGLVLRAATTATSHQPPSARPAATVELAQTAARPVSAINSFFATVKTDAATQYQVTPAAAQSAAEIVNEMNAANQIQVLEAIGGDLELCPPIEAPDSPHAAAPITASPAAATHQDHGSSASRGSIITLRAEAISSGANSATVVAMTTTATSNSAGTNGHALPKLSFTRFTTGDGKTDARPLSPISANSLSTERTNAGAAAAAPAMTMNRF